MKITTEKKSYAKSGGVPEQIRYCRASYGPRRAFAFPTDASKPVTANVRDWCGGRGASMNETVVPNTPITKFQITGLVERGEGGRAYKAIIAGTFTIDVREDVVLWAILGPGIRKGGWVHGKFIWVQNGTQMRLTRVGSDLHKHLLAVDAAKAVPKPKPIPTRDLVVGGVYADKAGYHSAYLGPCKLKGKRAHMVVDLIVRTDNRGSTQRRDARVAKVRPAQEGLELWNGSVTVYGKPPLYAATGETVRLPNTGRSYVNGWGELILLWDVLEG